MENSAYEALMIGVYVFVFIIALTSSIALMTNILDMADYANKVVVSGTGETIEENENIVYERLYSGEQVLAYYGRMKEDKMADKYNFRIKFSKLEAERDLTSYINSEAITNYIHDEFELTYKGVLGGKETYVFVLKQD